MSLAIISSVRRARILLGYAAISSGGSFICIHSSLLALGLALLGRKMSSRQLANLSYSVAPTVVSPYVGKIPTTKVMVIGVPVIALERATYTLPSLSSRIQSKHTLLRHMSHFCREMFSIKCIYSWLVMLWYPDFGRYHWADRKINASLPSLYATVIRPKQHKIQ